MQKPGAAKGCDSATAIRETSAVEDLGSKGQATCRYQGGHHCGGLGARQYPASDTVQKAMLPVVDRDGLTKPVLQIIAEEALESGIEEICVVSAPGDEAVYRAISATDAANLRSAFKGVR